MSCHGHGIRRLSADDLLPGRGRGWQKTTWARIRKTWASTDGCRTLHDGAGRKIVTNFFRESQGPSLVSRITDRRVPGRAQNLETAGA